MKPAFPILAAAVLLLGASSAEAARPMGGNSNIIIAPPPPLQSSLPPQINSGALNMSQPLGTPPVNTGAIGITSPSALGVPGQQTFGVLPDNPGSAIQTRLLPSLSSSGSALAPDQGSSATGISTPSTNVNGGM